MPSLLVEADELRQLARVDVVVALLDDHGRSSPPTATVLQLEPLVQPYFEPSRPMPDSFMPPKGATSVEMKPVLIPTIP